MNDSTSDVRNAPGEDDPSDRIEAIFLDGPGDTTVRPMRPHLRRHVLEQQERRARLMELWKQQQEQEKAKEALANGNKEQ